MRDEGEEEQLDDFASDEEDENYDHDVDADELKENEEAQRLLANPEATHFKYDFSHLRLKPDSERRPLWVCDRYVLLESFSPIYRQAYDFLIAIAEPISRPDFIHEYKITKYSLYAATSLGLHTADIIANLDKLSKVFLDERLLRFIRDATERCGKVKMVLKNSRYFLESRHEEVLRELLRDPTIATAAVSARESADRGDAVVDPDSGFLLVSADPAQPSLVLPGTNNRVIDERRAVGMVDEAEADSAPAAASAASAASAPAPRQAHPQGAKVLAFEFVREHVEAVRKRCSELQYPVLEEYDFRRDTQTKSLDIDLRPSTQIRRYQETSLTKMFGNGRARSGIIVLPCGAGKTLVGITAMCTIKKSVLVFCTTAMAVYQWRNQIRQFARVDSRLIRIFTKDHKEDVQRDTLILITTYNMVAFTGRRSDAAERIMKFIREHVWGLVVLDEVQVAPARMFRQCINITHSLCKIGLTATLVREDELIQDLYFLIGPKLYEANWLTLQDEGFLARVKCIEVWCSMTREFYQQHLSDRTTMRKQLLLQATNPTKFRTCQALIRMHEERGDKVLVFSDNIFALRLYAEALGKPMLYGDTSEQERQTLLRSFQTNPQVNCLFISKVGDNAIDLPAVSVIVQISSHFASRRQEAQRLGRILRPKPRTMERYNAYFYTLVTRDTKEMYYATKRQRFLVDQGYRFEVLDSQRVLEAYANKYGKGNLVLPRHQDEIELLERVLAADESAADAETLDEAGFAARRPGDAAAAAAAGAAAALPPAPARRTYTSIDAITGDDELAYQEVVREPSASSGSANAARRNLPPKKL